MKNKNITVLDYQQACWEYMMEHCEITKSGKYFIKFHTNSHKQFQGHVYNRIDGYHRGDPQKKEQTGIDKKAIHLDKKELKKYTYSQDKKKRTKAVKLKYKITNSPKWLQIILTFYGKNILKIL